MMGSLRTTAPFALGFAGSLACGSSPPPPASEAPVRPAPRTVPEPAPPRPLAGGGARYLAGDTFKDLGDGRSGAVASGRRVVLRGDQAQVVDAQPVEDIGRGTRIPDVLGGGWVFVGRRTVRHGPAFDGVLTVVASAAAAHGDVDVGVGHRRLLVRFGDSPPTLHELPSGKPVKLDPPDLSQLFGTDQGLVVAATSKGALFVERSDKPGWKKLNAPPVERLAYDGKGIVIWSRKGDLRLEVDGKLGPKPNEPGMIVADNLAAFALSFDFSKPPTETDPERLLSPLTRRMNEKAAFMVDETKLVFLDASTGKPLAEVEGAFAGKENCFPIRGGVPSFVGCNSNQVMALYRLESVGAKPVFERAFEGLYTQDFGAPSASAPLAFSGRCDGSKDKAVLCVREASGAWKERPPVADPGRLLDRAPFMAHAAASADGQAFAFAFLDGGGDLVIVDAKQSKVRTLPQSRVPTWAGAGVDWRALTIEPEALRFVLGDAKGTRPTSGIVEIHSDGRVTAEALAGRIAAHGSRALQVTPDGKLRETLDAGKTFTEIDPPPGGPPSGSDTFVCHETGCKLGPWNRAGWSAGTP